MSFLRSGLVSASLALVASAAGFFACSSTPSAAPGVDAAVSSSGQPPVQAGGLPCDVDAVLATHCRSCHQAPTRYGAPMPLLGYDDLVADSLTEPGTPVFQLSRERMREAGSRMPPPPNAAVPDADLAVFDRWIANGTPRGPAQCDSVVAPEPELGLDCTPDVTLRPPTKFTMPKDASDEYVCYGVDVTAEQARHIFAMTPSVDNTNILHHVLLFESPKAFTPTPTPCSSGGSIDWRLVYGWAPGGSSIILPPEAGMPLSGTTHYVVQLHYNNVRGLEGERDGSGFDLCSTTQLRPNDADVIAFGTSRFSLPPSSRRTYDCSFPIPEQVGAGVRFIAAMPHMHQLGASISTTVERAETAQVFPLGIVDDWNFQTQYWQPLGVDVVAGDTIRTRCTWENRGSSQVEFGEDTADEMCYSFSMYYPRIPNLLWALPAELARCTHTDEPLQ